MILIYAGLLLIITGIVLFFYSLVLFLLSKVRKKSEYQLFCDSFDAEYGDILPKKALQSSL